MRYHRWGFEVKFSYRIKLLRRFFESAFWEKLDEVMTEQTEKLLLLWGIFVMRRYGNS